MGWASALWHTNYYNVYLGFETVPGSPGTGLVTLTPRGGGINRPTAGALGRRSLSPSRRLIYSQMRRISATFGAIW